MKTRSLQSLPNLLPFEAEGLAGLLNLPNLPFSDFGSQSNTNSESTKSTISRIDTNQTHPMLDMISVEHNICDLSDVDLCVMFLHCL